MADGTDHCNSRSHYNLPAVRDMAAPTVRWRYPIVMPGALSDWALALMTFFAIEPRLAWPDDPRYIRLVTRIRQPHMVRSGS